MIPILTPEEVRALDAASTEPLDVLIARAGAAVARHALELLGGSYGRRVVVLAGKGNNGADGRVTAAILARRGVRCRVLDAAALPSRLPAADLVIDAAYGTGFRGSWPAPETAAPVLAVDIPSGVDATTGVAAGRVLGATRTVTFAALKPGHLLAEGSDLAGDLVLADIGLDADAVTKAHLLLPADLALVPRDRDSHKWRHATWVVAGSRGMTGAAVLAARGAQRAGAGYVRLSVPGGDAGESTPLEVVATSLSPQGWAEDVLSGAGRFHSIVIGPGLGRGSDRDVRRLVAEATVPVVVDADGLTALGADVATFAQPTTILTPHDGEYERLAGHRPGPDRFAAARDLATRAGCVVLLKGPTTIVAGPDGRVLATNTGDARLATAGTGDVLAGMIGALAAQGLAPLEAAAFGAHLHGLAGRAGWGRGLVAGDLPDLLPTVFESLER